MDKFFSYVGDIVFRARSISCVSAVNLELIFGSNTDSVRFPVIATAPTPILLLEPFVYMCFHHLCLFSTTSLKCLEVLK